MSDRRYRQGREDLEDVPPDERPPRRGNEGRWPDVRSTTQDAIKRAGSLGNRRPPARTGTSNNRPIILICVLVLGVAILGGVLYALFSRSEAPVIQTPAATQPANRSTPPATDTTSPPAESSARRTEADSVIGQIFGSDTATPSQTPPESWVQRSARITLRLALAALLAAALAFRPRKDLPILQRNPYVAQTQILLAVVASALMMVVADNAARAFGIFAAASLVRFRTNIRDPKEITVLLISLAIGLASGVGRLEVAVILSLFVLLMLWVLEYYEPAQVFRAMELRVKTRNVTETDEILKEIFEKHNFTAEVREVNLQDEKDPLGRIVYYVNVSPNTSTDQLSEEIFSSDPDQIDSIEWDQKKSTSYIYR